MDPIEPKFVEKPAFHVVGMCGWFRMESAPGQIPGLWERFVPRLPDIANKTTGFACYGVCFHPPGSPQEAPSDFFYMAAVSVNDLRAIPDDMVGKTIPAARYAVFTHRGGLKTFHDTIRWIWCTWLPGSGLRAAATPDFELYDERFDPSSDSGEIDVYVPLAR